MSKPKTPSSCLRGMVCTMACVIVMGCPPHERTSITVICAPPVPACSSPFCCLPLWLPLLASCTRAYYQQDGEHYLQVDVDYCQQGWTIISRASKIYTAKFAQSSIVSICWVNRSSATSTLYRGVHSPEGYVYPGLISDGTCSRRTFRMQSSAMLFGQPVGKTRLLPMELLHVA